jgi:DNA-directed RNA polymerase subunit E"
MTTKDKVCRNCKRFVKGDVCPVCSQAKFSRSWKGIVVINDPQGSEIATTLNITAPGKYCLWTK